MYFRKRCGKLEFFFLHVLLVLLGFTLVSVVKSYILAHCFFNLRICSCSITFIRRRYSDKRLFSIEGRLWVVESRAVLRLGGVPLPKTVDCRGGNIAVHIGYAFSYYNNWNPIGTRSEPDRCGTPPSPPKKKHFCCHSIGCNSFQQNFDFFSKVL